MILVWIIAATLIVSLISLIGIFTLALKEELLNKSLIFLIGLAAGGLIGGAFIHILPETLQMSNVENIFIYTMVGFVVFFIFERYVHWRHCHKENCDIHAFTYLSLLGDGFHNFIDGLVIAVSFMTSTKLGIVTTLAVILHEIPQEIGDFGILVYGGYKKGRALFLNFLCAMTAMLGAIIGYFLAGAVQNISVFLLPFTAGGFIYIASCDLIPELHRQPDQKRANLSLASFILGIILMWWFKSLYIE